MSEKAQAVKNQAEALLTKAINAAEEKTASRKKNDSREKATAASALLTAIDFALGKTDGPLLQMAVRRFKAFCEEGIRCPALRPRIKAVCMVALRSGSYELLNDFLPVYMAYCSLQMRRNEALPSVMSLLGCLAFKDGAAEVGDVCVKLLLTMPAKTEAASETELLAIKQIALAGARGRNEQGFCRTLKRLERYYEGREELPEEEYWRDFFLTVLFASADHRWNKGVAQVIHFFSPILQKQINVYETKEKVVYEWLQIISQMARRDWPDTVEVLQQGLLKFLWRSRDEQLIDYGLGMLCSGAKMQIDWNGFASAFKMYYQWQVALLLQIDYYRHGQGKERRKSAENAVRMLWEFNAHAVRSSFEDTETRVFEEWLRLWQEEIGKREKLSLRAKRTVQLVILYWNHLQPEKSQQQMPYLMNLFQPNHLDDSVRDLLWK